nr:MAG TPA: hypothetical protein [Caudoviricetes sp.]
MYARSNRKAPVRPGSLWAAWTVPASTRLIRLRRAIPRISAASTALTKSCASFVSKLGILQVYP